jgi:hypothetical protein
MIITSTVISIQSDSFKDCSGMSKFTVSTNNKYYKSKYGILYTKSGKTLVTCPAGKSGNLSLSAGLITIAKNAFYGCNQIKTIMIPYGVTTIRENAFYGCNALTKVTIPATVTRIYDGAFSACTHLASAYFLGNAPKMGVGVFAYAPSTLKIYYYTNKKGFSNPWNGATTVGRKYIYVKSVKLSKSLLAIRRTKTYKLTATINPSNASNKRVTWKSGNKAIATVGASGIVKGIRKGTTYIYVHTVNGNKTARCKVTVK